MEERNGDFSYPRKAVVLVAALLCCAWAASASAIAQIRFQDPFEHAIGLSGAFVAFEVEPVTAPSLIAEAGGRFLFDTPDLKTGELRLGFRHSAVGVLASSVILQSPVGTASTVSVEPFVQRAAAGLGIELSRHSLTLDGLEGASALTAGARARVRLAQSVHLGYTIENVRLAGEPLPGADTSLYALVLRGVSGVLQLRINRYGTVAVSIASWVRFNRFLSIAVGYDDETAMLKGAAAVRVGNVSLSLGASLHAYLGVSKSAFVTWRR